MPRFAPNTSAPPSRGSTVLALRLGAPASPALQLRAERQHQQEIEHADLQRHRADEKAEKAIDQEIDRANLLQRQLDGELKRATTAANLTKTLIDLQQKVKGTHDLTNLFLHLADLDPADPDYGTQVAQLRLSYPHAAMVPGGSKAIDDALKAAAPQQAVYAPLREVLGDLSAFTKRTPDGGFVSFNLRDAQDAKDRRQMERFNTMPAGTTGTLPLGGGASVRVTRPRPLDITGIMLTPDISTRVTQAGAKATGTARAMLNGDIEPLPAMAAEVARIKGLTPSEQRQWIDDFAQNEMHKEVRSIKAEKTDPSKLQKDRRAKLKEAIRRNDNEIKRMKDAPEAFIEQTSKSGWATPDDYVAARTTDLQKQNSKLLEEMNSVAPATTQQPVSPVSDATLPTAPATPQKPASSFRDRVFGGAAPKQPDIASDTAADELPPAPTTTEETLSETPPTPQNDSDGDGVLDADELQGSTLEVEDDPDGNPMAFAVTSTGNRIPMPLSLKRAEQKVASAADAY